MGKTQKTWSKKCRWIEVNGEFCWENVRTETLCHFWRKVGHRFGFCFRMLFHIGRCFSGKQSCGYQFSISSWLPCTDNMCAKNHLIITWRGGGLVSIFFLKGNEKI